MYERPHLPRYQEWYLRAFWDLDSERDTGWSLGRIPGSKVEEYAERVGIAEHLKQAFHDIVRSLDDAYLSWHRNKRGKE